WDRENAGGAATLRPDPRRVGSRCEGRRASPRKVGESHGKEEREVRHEEALGEEQQQEVHEGGQAVRACLFLREEIEVAMSPRTVTIPASVALFGLGWMWVGFWPTLVFTVIAPAL